MQLFEEGRRDKTPTPEEQTGGRKKLSHEGGASIRVMKDPEMLLGPRPFPAIKPILEGCDPILRNEAGASSQRRTRRRFSRPISMLRRARRAGHHPGEACAEGWKVAGHIAESGISAVILGPRLSLREQTIMCLDGRTVSRMRPRHHLRRAQ